MDDNQVMFNAYPDSCGGRLSAIVEMLESEELRGIFGLFYILPSLFRSDLDRGFSVISYELDEELARQEDLERLRELGMELKLDFVVNHLSAQSPQFRDVTERAAGSPYRPMFLDWNEFWAGHGEVGPEGHIVPEERYLSRLFLRKPGLPVLRVEHRDGSVGFYWNTFYQKVLPGEPPRYLGQIDLDARSDLVWEFYEQTLDTLASYGTRIVRLDAFAYLHKEVGASNFFNTPGTWEYLERVSGMAEDRGMEVLPEIHSTYEAGTHRELAEHGYRIYDFFSPALIIHAIERGTAGTLAGWIAEVRDRGYRTVNMLGCHDGIPVLDVRGLLEEEEIQELIELIVSRGGKLKDLYGPDGKKLAYYQVNATFFSALGEDADSLLLARAVQLFLPGIPQIWYLDLFAGTNDYEAAETHGHKEINRTNLSPGEISARLQLPVVRRQLELLRFRSSSQAFGPEAQLTVGGDAPGELILEWRRGEHLARLQADLKTRRFVVTAGTEEGVQEI